jgi:hypothetical protein
MRRQMDWANYGRLNPHLHDLQTNRPDFPAPISVSVEPDLRDGEAAR